MSLPMMVCHVTHGIAQASTTVAVEDGVTPRAHAAAGAAPAEGSKLSRLGALLNTLLDLAQRDPEHFRRAMASFTGRLDEAARAQTGGGKKLFEALARRFRQCCGATAQESAPRTFIAGHPRAGWVEQGALEDFLESSLKESARSNRERADKVLL
jgi:hypothetical protein